MEDPCKFFRGTLSLLISCIVSASLGCVLGGKGVGTDGGVGAGGSAEFNFIISKGYSEEQAKQIVALATDRGIKDSALRNFFSVLAEDPVPADELDHKLRQFAHRYKALLKDIRNLRSEDPEVKRFQARAAAAVEAGEFVRAEKLMQHAYQIDINATHQLQQNLTTRKLSAAASAYTLGQLKMTQVAYSAAVIYYQQAVDLVPTGNDQLLLTYLDSLAESHWEAGSYSQAERILKETIGIAEKLPGPNLILAENFTHLGIIYFEQGRYADAEQFFLKALDIKRNTLGDDHPETGRTAENLAHVYVIQGRPEAETLYRQSLVITRKSVGEVHPLYATSLEGLAHLYIFQKRYAEAEPMLETVLSIRENSSGKSHPIVAIALVNLATVYFEQGLYSKAEPLYERALIITQEKLGPDHPKLVAILQNLGSVRFAQIRYAESEVLYQRALSIVEKLGSYHLSGAKILNKMGDLRRAQGRNEESEVLYGKALILAEKALAQHHRDAAQILQNIADVYAEQGRYAEAELLFQKTLKAREDVLGKDNLFVARTLVKYATVLRKLNRVSEADQIDQRAVLIFSRDAKKDFEKNNTSQDNPVR